MTEVADEEEGDEVGAAAQAASLDLERRREAHLALREDPRSMDSSNASEWAVLEVLPTVNCMRMEVRSKDVLEAMMNANAFGPWTVKTDPTPTRWAPLNQMAILLTLVTPVAGGLPQPQAFALLRVHVFEGQHTFPIQDAMDLLERGARIAADASAIFVHVDGRTTAGPWSEDEVPGEPAPLFVHMTDSRGRAVATLPDGAPPIQELSQLRAYKLTKLLNGKAILPFDTYAANPNHPRTPGYSRVSEMVHLRPVSVVPPSTGSSLGCDGDTFCDISIGPGALTAHSLLVEEHGRTKDKHYSVGFRDGFGLSGPKPRFPLRGPSTPLPVGVPVTPVEAGIIGYGRRAIHAELQQMELYRVRDFAAAFELNFQAEVAAQKGVISVRKVHDVNKGRSEATRNRAVGDALLKYRVDLATIQREWARSLASRREAVLINRSNETLGSLDYVAQGLAATGRFDNLLDIGRTMEGFGLMPPPPNIPLPCYPPSTALDIREALGEEGIFGTKLVKEVPPAPSPAKPQGGTGVEGQTKPTTTTPKPSLVAPKVMAPSSAKIKLTDWKALQGKDDKASSKATAVVVGTNQSSIMDFTTTRLRGTISERVPAADNRPPPPKRRKTETSARGEAITVNGLADEGRSRSRSRSGSPSSEDSSSDSSEAGSQGGSPSGDEYDRETVDEDGSPAIISDTDDVAAVDSDVIEITATAGPGGFVRTVEANSAEDARQIVKDRAMSCREEMWSFESITVKALRANLQHAGLLDTKKRSTATTAKMQVAFASHHSAQVRTFSSRETGFPEWLRVDTATLLSQVRGQLRKGIPKAEQVDHQSLFIIIEKRDWSLQFLLTPLHSPDAIQKTNYGGAASTGHRQCPFCAHVSTNDGTFLKHVIGDHYRCAFICGRCTEKPTEGVPAWNDPSNFSHHFKTHHADISNSINPDIVPPCVENRFDLGGGMPPSLAKVTPAKTSASTTVDRSREKEKQPSSSHRSHSSHKSGHKDRHRDRDDKKDRTHKSSHRDKDKERDRDRHTDRR